MVCYVAACAINRISLDSDCHVVVSHVASNLLSRLATFAYHFKSLLTPEFTEHI